LVSARGGWNSGNFADFEEVGKQTLRKAKGRDAWKSEKMWAKAGEGRGVTNLEISEGDPRPLGLVVFYATLLRPLVKNMFPTQHVRQSAAYGFIHQGLIRCIQTLEGRQAAGTYALGTDARTQYNGLMARKGTTGLEAALLRPSKRHARARCSRRSGSRPRAKGSRSRSTASFLGVQETFELELIYVVKLLLRYDNQTPHACEKGKSHEADDR
jgi:hypothetical protein